MDRWTGRQRVADYYPLITRAVAALAENTGAARRELYQRTRTMLADQLQRRAPPLSESEIRQERLNLEQAIRKVEVETVRNFRESLRKPPTS